MQDPSAGAYELAQQYIARAQESGASALNLTPEAAFSVAHEAFPANELFGSLSELPPEIGELTSLETLVLVNAPISDLAPIAGLASLKALFLGSSQARDLGPLAGLTGLTSLDLNDTGVADLAPLVKLTALTTLTFNRTQVTDLSPLAGLQALERIELQNTPVADVAPLAGLTALRSLALSGTAVADLTPLARLEGLQRIWLGGTVAVKQDPTLAELARNSDTAEGAARLLAYLRGEKVDVPSSEPSAVEDGEARRPEGSAGVDRKRQAVQTLQQELRSIGLDPGPADGIVGPQTKAALAQTAFPEAPDIEQMVSQRFPDLDSKAVYDIAELLDGRTGSPTLSLKDDDEQAAGGSPIAASVAELQRHLIEEGLLEDAADGILGVQTRDAIYALAERRGLSREVAAEGGPRPFAVFPAIARRLAPDLSSAATELLAYELFRDGVQMAWKWTRPVKDAVVELQTLLVEQGRMEGPADGVFGPLTHAGLTALAAGLPRDDDA